MIPIFTFRPNIHRMLRWFVGKNLNANTTLLIYTLLIYSF